MFQRPRQQIHSIPFFGEKTMDGKRIVLSVIVLAGLVIVNTSCQKDTEIKSKTPSAARVVVNFNRDWKFIKQDPCGAELPAYNDSSWKKIRLPHDWAIAGPFNPKEDGFAGKLPWRGVGWYRKNFTLDKADSGKRVYFDFDGVMAFPMVYINGKLAGQWDYGYMSFRVDATPFVKFGKENVIAVRADTRNHGTRWYPGAGIYRKVTMSICEPVHIAHWGTYITTPKITDNSATINVQTTVENHRKSKAKPNIEVTLIDPDGKSVAALTAAGTIPANGSGDINQTFVIPNPQRWDINTPKIYSVETIVREGNKIVDSDTTTFGIREFQFTVDDGFHLNGRRVQIKGVCLHHDQGALGAAFNTRAMERQLEIMKDMGANALRTSHNPPAPEVLELCDRMGFVVWNEVFDKWDKTADRDGNKPALEQYGEKQIKNFVMRDRNHPSVFIWSIGNEIPVRTKKEQEGLTTERVKFMSDYFRKYDPTRPVSLACNIPSVASSHILDALDFAGWNYQRNYTTYRKRYPQKSAVYSESASAISTRGFYELPLAEKKTQYSSIFQISSYDRNAAPWADMPDVEFNRMEQDSYVAGEFVWTGFDYLGEPTPFSKQARSSYFGIVDTAGIPKDRYYIYRSYWAPEKTTVHILPHWNWPDRLNQNVPVYVYTNGDSAELFLNGKSLGKRSKAEKIEDPIYYNIIDKYRLCFNDVNYEPGELKAVAYKDGVEIGQAIIRTAGEPAKIRLTPDRTRIATTGDDLSYILIEAVDANDTLCPLADNLIRFKIEGPGEIAGADNGNPLSIEPFKDDKHKLFFGKAVLIVRTEEGQFGEIRVTAESDGLKTAQIVVHSE
jgi:beta-galactosidase